MAPIPNVARDADQIRASLNFSILTRLELTEHSHSLDVFFGVYWSLESRRKLISMLDEVKAVTDAVFRDFVKRHGTPDLASQAQPLAEWSVTAGAMTISKEQGIWYAGFHKVRSIYWLLT
jgi:hypothetical protein